MRTIINDAFVPRDNVCIFDLFVSLPPNRASVVDIKNEMGLVRILYEILVKLRVLKALF